MDYIVRTEKLSKWYGKILGLSDVNLDITRGVKGLLGPNGAGKSTFLKLLAGQIRPSIGSVYIFGKEVISNTDIFEKIGYCPEYDSFYKEMTGEEFIFSLLKLSGFKTDRAKEFAENALSDVGLTERKDDFIRNYSLGMRQRLKFAQSIAHKPELLLLDEPLKGVDPIWRSRIIKIINEFARQNKTVIVSSHILQEIEAMTDNIILINQSKIFAEGDLHYIRDLIDTHPYKIFVKTEKIRKLASILMDNSFVLSVNFSNEGLIIETSNRDLLLKIIMKYSLDNDFEIYQLTSPDDNLQAVFDYLIER